MAGQEQRNKGKIGNLLMFLYLRNRTEFVVNNEDAVEFLKCQGLKKVMEELETKEIASV